jgi:hypothetical protein
MERMMIVRPFGVFGGRYEVGRWGAGLYIVSWAIVAALILSIGLQGVGFTFFGGMFFGAVFGVLIALCLLVAKLGRRLPDCVNLADQDR